MTRGIVAAKLNPFQDVGLRLLPKSVQSRDPRIFAGGFELLDRADLQLLVKRFDFSGTKPRNLQQRKQTRRKRRLKVLVVGEFAGRRQFHDLLLNRFADAFDLSQPIFADELLQRFRKAFERTRGSGIGARLERVFALQLQQYADLDQNFGYLIFVHE